MSTSTDATRRGFLTMAGGMAAITVTPFALTSAQATPDSLAAAIHAVVGGAVVHAGRVKLDVPPLVENGNTVPVTVSVSSPMTDTDFVRSIHLFNEKNPQPNVGNFFIGPCAGRAEVGTRMRLADTQKIVAIARLSDGSFWSVSADVVVTLAACTEEAG
ncbi:SoxY-related AACIE arm protein [Rhodopseudomonas sp. RCAM05734]|uniref:SoxY-related AACIE arm protein n=1 Tax=Rhodopseudomonas sp. RCAM05734 TaxID=3457549 RepID=UPI004044ECFE